MRESKRNKPSSAVRADTPDTATTRPFASLTPETLFAALDGIGLHADGRLLALNSYENRVYQFYEDADAGPVARVVKFYRAGRWSDAAIREEHAYCRELAERELPVVAPL